MQEVAPPETIIIRKDSPAAWVYRVALFVGMAILGGLGWRMSDSVLNKLDTLLAVPEQVRRQGEKIEEQGRRLAEVGDKVDRLAADQAGYAKADDLTRLRSDLDKVDGRVQALENIYSPPEPPGRRK